MDKMRGFLLVTIAALAGCSLFSVDDHANALKVAVQDDQTCAASGPKYPDPRYVFCRMQLQDDRLHQAWLNMQLMRQSAASQPNQVPAPYTGHELYHPLNPQYFSCQPVTEYKHDYILCAEDEKAENAGNG